MALLSREKGLTLEDNEEILPCNFLESHRFLSIARCRVSKHPIYSRSTVSRGVFPQETYLSPRPLASRHRVILQNLVNHEKPIVYRVES